MFGMGCNATFNASHNDLLLRSANWKEPTSAVGQEVFFDVVTICLEQNIGAAQVPDLFGGPLDHAMTLTGLGIDNFAGAGDFKALFSA